MSKILLPTTMFILSLFGFMHNMDSSYEELWKQVVHFQKEQRPQSAAKVVDQILEKAANEQNYEQITKASFYKSSFLLSGSEEGYDEMLTFLRKQIEVTPSPYKQILHQAYAISLHSYLQSNYYTVSQRVRLEEKNGEDPKSWSANIFHNEITHHYRASLENADDLNLPVEEIELLLNKLDQDGAEYAPTLYDLLARQAISYFSKPSSYVAEAQHAFELDKDEYFGNALNFISLEPQTTDRSAQLFLAFEFYQKYLSWNIAQSNLSALALADLQRLNFVYNNSTNPGKHELYLNSLRTMASTYRSVDTYSEILYQQAQALYDKSGRVKRKEALQKEIDVVQGILEYCQEAVSAYPNSIGAQKAAGLYNQIYRKEVNARYEQVILPNESSLLFLQTRNIEEIEYRIVKLSTSEWDEIHTRGRNDNRELFFSKDPVRQGVVRLADDLLYYAQSSEIELPPLELGHYAILTTEKGSGFGNNDPVFSGTFTVSNLAYSLQNTRDGHELLISHRRSGQAEAGVAVDIFRNYYHRQERRHKKEFLRQDISDKQGRINLDNLDSRDTGYSFKLSKGDDHLSFNQNQHLYQYDYTERPREEFLIFTDRAIYRPGQQVHYKVLAIRKDEFRVPVINPEVSLNVQLTDVNHQLVEKSELRSNTFGTASGSFTVPKNGLKGNMNIKVSGGSGGGYKNIRVEEYKRPKFYTEIDKVTGEYKLSDTINITTRGLNFAGNPLQGATVNYRVKREVRFPFWSYWRYNPYIDQGNAREITHGSGVLNEKGEFEFDFVAIPDLTVEERFKPVFRYTVMVDVTDINGETHSAETTVPVSNQTMSLNIDFPKQLLKGQEVKLAVSAVNLNGTKLEADGELKIVKLEEPERIFRKRYWQHPDTILIDRSEFESRLNSYSYGATTGIESWEEGREVLERPFHSSAEDQLDYVDLPEDLEAGGYKLIAQSTDKNGLQVTTEHFFTVLDFEKGRFPKSDLLFYHLDKEQYQPEDEVMLQLASPVNNISVYYFVERKNRLDKGKWLDLSSPGTIKVPVHEGDRGGLGVHILYVYNNRFFKEYIPINVPWNNKKLDISFETFRDKLIPGADELIKVKIKSPADEPHLIEMLAGMYDASLDQFVRHEWSDNLRYLYPKFNARFGARSFGFTGLSMRPYNRLSNDHSLNSKHKHKAIPAIDFSLLQQYYGSITMRSARNAYMDGVERQESGMLSKSAAPMAEGQVVDEMASMDSDGMADDMKNKDVVDANETVNPAPSANPIRSNLKETVFFFPELITEEDGSISIRFTMGEALTKWKLMSFVHDKELRYAYNEQELVTQKDLMVFPNLPRFLRDGDDIWLQTKIVNLTDKQLEGKVRLELVDPVSGSLVHDQFDLSTINQDFEIGANASTVSRWKLRVPDRALDAVLVRVIAEAGNHSDGEENLLAVLTDRKLVTETRSIIVDKKSTKRINFESLAENRSSTLVYHQYSLEYTPNPAWYAIQALPYLMEYPYKCTEQVLNRFYANSLSQFVVNSDPGIKRVFDVWSTSDADALLSNLEKNEDLKTALLKETPWLLDAKSESAAKKRIANLFDINKMAGQRDDALNTLKKRQLHNGGFPWFSGGYDNWYISQYIVENLGHMHKLGVFTDQEKMETNDMLTQAVGYIDMRMNEHYLELKKMKADMSRDHLNNMIMHYLYARSFFPDMQLNESYKEAYDYYLDQARKYGLDKGIYGGAMISLSLLRMDERASADRIRISLLERALRHEELGMYWNEGSGYHWYELPIERHALMIELLHEFDPSDSRIDDLKKWLLLNKQTNNWKTTKATSAAIFALMITGEDTVSNWIKEEANTEITIGSHQVDMSENAEVATAYVRKNWYKSEIETNMSEVVIKNNSDHLGWGGLYWQYFEDLSKIEQFDETPLRLKKEIYKIELDENGEKLINVSNKSISIGDKILVRLELQTDRSMEFVHLKDMRASGFEPLSTNSGYKWSHGLFYYESPGDLATDFFIDYLEKGNYVFEYRLVATQAGIFSNGIATIQNMYAPEYSSHSNGLEITIE